MKWAISGGAGFLGLHLARRLVADGHEVRTLDRAAIRTWAREQGIAISDRGRLSTEIINKYKAAH